MQRRVTDVVVGHENENDEKMTEFTADAAPRKTGYAIFRNPMELPQMQTPVKAERVR